MDLKIGDTVGPWIIQEIIKDEPGRVIASVKTEDDPLLWVLKIVFESEEYQKIIKYTIDNCEHGLKMPDLPTLSCGKYRIYDWFVMEKFDHDCSKRHTINHYEFVKSIVMLLKHLHLTHNVIHGDLKLNNVLHKNGKYRVCDFEAVLAPEIDTLCDESNYNNYYYYSYGAEYKKPVNTYKYDFQALGYMLLVIDNDFTIHRFQTLAHSYYNKKIKSNLYVHLDCMRSRLNPSEKTRQYFALVERIDWFSLTPPPLVFYDEIISIFR